MQGFVHYKVVSNFRYHKKGKMATILEKLRYLSNKEEVIIIIAAVPPSFVCIIHLKEARIPGMLVCLT